MICVDVCRHKAIASAREINAKGYILPIEEDMTRCKACGLCESMCPDFAIAIEEVDEEG
jgi:2-oxoglutarate ferredoxin oxidoreductase subunit delta